MQTMVTVVPPSTRVFTPLPVDGRRGFPQSFPVTFDGASYVFTLYVNVDPELVNEKTAFIPMPTNRSHLVVKVERDREDGSRDTVFLRKVVSALEYLTDTIALRFDRQTIARNSLNAVGDFGSQVDGGIARRWA
jgi:hypothetical protein